MHIHAYTHVHVRVYVGVLRQNDIGCSLMLVMIPFKYERFASATVNLNR